MKTNRIARRPRGARSADRSGKMKPMVLLWALGIPLPIVIVIALFRGCMG